ncbi:MAG TPA: sigma-70 family RNA polymerase sigma factor [Solirubrobacteraceae bacterium]|nr:sigma-70 family RNA polymerase sigma factor [Solirubrobacteraceae bacterium]
MNPSRVDALFREHGADVLAYALRRTDPDTAQDVVAEVFAIAWRRINRVPDTEPVLWLYAVARRVLANQRRAADRRQALVAVLRPLAARQASADNGDLPLVAALARLRPDDRELLMLTAWEGLDATQAAAVLGCSRQAVDTRMHRARARLRAELDRQAQEVSIA